ncbi:MAG: alpha/beta hydrolase [Xanthomonadaceae bacterium]|nr:alpha/beta hydrolase [Xanthomonadaceae bacterium]
MRRFFSSLLLLLGMLAGCYPKGDPDKPIPTLLVPALQPAHRLVVVLPGRGDDLRGLQRAGIAQAIHSRWPDADVVLTGLAMGYYLKGNAISRLHDEIIAPARARYGEVWLLGASLGGLGALMYDGQWPGTVDGIVLMAPYLGEKPLLRRIDAAGGIARWNPGPVPAQIDGNNFQHELWRHLQTWSRDPSRSANVWLAYGDHDYLRETMPSLTPLLPPSHVFVRPGRHAWHVWTPATVEILAAIKTQRAHALP